MAKMKMAGSTRLWSDGPHEGKGDTRTSAPQNTSVGGGSRPTPSKIKIASSAPADDYTQGRGVPGALK